MARFTPEFLNNTVLPNKAWKKITDALKNGNKSVEVLSRVINGKNKWELRCWNGKRNDGSNSKQSSKNRNY